MPIYLWEFEKPLVMREEESPNDRFLRVLYEEITCRRQIAPLDPIWETHQEDVTPKQMANGNYRYEVLAFNDENKTGIVTMRPNTEYPIGVVSSQYGKSVEYVSGRRSFALGPYEGTYRRRFPILQKTHKGIAIERMVLWSPSATSSQ